MWWIPAVPPRPTFTADGGGLHLQPLPGTDLTLLLGLSHVVIHEGLADADFIQARTTGYDAVVRSVNAFWPERVQSITGVPAELIRETARRLADGARKGGSYILTGRGVEQHVDGTDTATAAINLSLLLGLPGSARSGYGTLTGQGNGQGGREHGQKADQLPGYRKITDPAARAHMAGVWGVPGVPIPGPGLPAVQLLKSLGQPDGVRCLFVHASNIAVASPDANAVIAGLRSLDFLVVCDFFMSETAAEADLILPVLQWAEEEGTLTNLEGRVLRRRRAIQPPAGARSELWIMARLAEALEAPSTYSEDPETVFEELRLASAGGLADYSGIDYAMLDRGEAAYWPYPAGSTGTPRLFLDALCARRRQGGHDPGDAPPPSYSHGRQPGPGRQNHDPHHRPPAGALPVRCPDPARVRAAGRPARGEDADPSGRRGRHGHHRRRAWSRWPTSAARWSAGPSSAPPSARKPCSCPSTSRNSKAPTG